MKSNLAKTILLFALAIIIISAIPQGMNNEIQQTAINSPHSYDDRFPVVDSITSKQWYNGLNSPTNLTDFFTNYQTPTFTSTNSTLWYSGTANATDLMNYPQGSYSYLIFPSADGLTVYAKNGSTGIIDNSSADLGVTINALAGSGVIFHIKSGTFPQATPIQYLSNMTIEGEGIYSTKINATAITTDYSIKAGTHTAAIMGLNLRDFSVFNGKDGLQLLDVWNPRIENVEFLNGTGNGCVVDGGEYGASGILATHFFIRWYTNGISFGVSGAGFVSINKFIGGGSVGCSSTGMTVTDLGNGSGAGITNFMFEGMQIESNNWGVRWGDGVVVSNAYFINCYFDSNVVNDLMNFANASNTVVIGGLIHADKIYQAVDHSITFDKVSFVTESSGSLTNTTATTFVFAHGCAGTLTGLWCSFNDTGITGYSWVNTNATFATVTLQGTPTGATPMCYWTGEYKP